MHILSWCSVCLWTSLKLVYAAASAGIIQCSRLAKALQDHGCNSTGITTETGALTDASRPAVRLARPAEASMSGSSTSSRSGSTAAAPSCSPSTPVSSRAKRSAANPTCSQGGTRHVSTCARLVLSYAMCWRFCIYCETWIRAWFCASTLSKTALTSDRAPLSVCSSLALASSRNPLWPALGFAEPRQHAARTAVSGRPESRPPAVPDRAAYCAVSKRSARATS